MSARPFNSGLQISFWYKAHFKSLLQWRGSIWDFEHQTIIGVNHYAITVRAPIGYTHMVDKGRWLPYGRTLLRRAGFSTELGARPVWPRIDERPARIGQGAHACIRLHHQLTAPLMPYLRRQ
jgi:hypothetical protein